MNNISDIDESRRQFLIYQLSTGALTTIAGCGASGLDNSYMPEEMPASRSIFKFSGDVRVNGQSVSLSTPIKTGDVIETLVGRTTPYVVPRGITRTRSRYF